MPLNLRADKVVHQKEGDRVEKAITTDASLEAAQATRSERVLEQPSEPPLPEGHTSGSREGRMEHPFALMNFIPPTPHDSPLSGGYTPGSNEGRLKLEELIVICTTLANRVTTLENELSTTKAIYHKAFITLTKRVKKLESQLKQKRSRVVIHSSDEEEPSETAETSKDDDDATLAETLLNIRRSSAKDKGKGICKRLSYQRTKEATRQDQERHNLEKALELQRQLDQRKEDVAKGDQAKKIDWNDPTVLRYHALQNRPFSEAKVRKNMIMYLKNQRGNKQSHFKGMKYKDIRLIFKRVYDQVHTFVPKDSEIEKEVMKKAGFDFQQGSSKKQRLDQQTEQTEETKEDVKAQGDSDQEIEEIKLYMRIIPNKDIAIDAIPLATKPSVSVKYNIIKEGKISTYLIIRVDGSTKRYTSMINLLENIDREDLETLWKLVQDKHGDTRPEEGYKRVLWGDLKVIFKPDVESKKIKYKKLDDLEGNHKFRGALLGIMHFYNLVLLIQLNAASED
nr:hypothetical protein [Tanacetum cinerariifolium]